MIEKGHLFNKIFLNQRQPSAKFAMVKKVYLNVTKDAVHRAGWENDPESEVLRRPEMPLDPQ